jgi:ankyrin repeat protein
MIETSNNDGMALLCHAVRGWREGNAFSPLKCLLGAGADVHYKGPNGSATIHTAASHHYTFDIELLLEYGADPTMEDLEHMTPLVLLKNSWSSSRSWSEDLLNQAILHRTRTENS